MIGIATQKNTQGAQPLTGSIIPGQLPVKGLNFRDALSRMMPDDAVMLANMLSDANGLTVRNGFQEFATGIPTLGRVGTIMSYYPATAGGSFARAGNAINALSRESRDAPSLNILNLTLEGQLFACANNRIYDITAGGAGPWTEQAGINGPSDYWTWVNFQNAAGNFLLAVNDEGSYISFGGAGFSSGFSTGFSTAFSGFNPIQGGTQPGQINGVNPDLFAHIAVWKRRLWFCEKDSSRAWYLPVEQITGTATMFDFGPWFKRGGHLVSLNGWTIDGGEGIDDYLVAVGSEGDVVIYKGYDPDQAADDPNAFQLHGVWYIGALPKGRRQCDDHGGDLYILSQQGINQISKLVAAAQIAGNLVEDVGFRLDPRISELMKDYSELDGWYIRSLPGEQLILVGVPPVTTGQGNTQFALAMRQKAWSIFTGMAFQTFSDHSSLTFAGGNSTLFDGDDKVYLCFQNTTDNALLDGTVGQPIASRVIPAYQNLGAGGMAKRFTMIRPTLSYQGNPSIKVQTLTDFQGGTYYNVPSLPQNAGSLWNQSNWNQGVWGGLKKTTRDWIGVTGSGYAATVQFDMTSLGGTVLANLDWWVVQGGPL